MLTHLLSLLGLTLLCAGWMVFQIWYRRANPEREGFSAGCGGCKGGSCSTPNNNEKSGTTEQPITIADR